MKLTLSKRNLYVFLVLFIVIVLFVLFSLVGSGTNNDSSGGNTNFITNTDDASTATSPDAGAGNNKNSTVVKPPFVYEEKPLVDGTNYKIVYYPPTNNYHIIILEAPFSKNRQAAEEEFRTLMKLSVAELCKLDVSVTAPKYVSEDFGGKTLKLSICE